MPGEGWPGRARMPFVESSHGDAVAGRLVRPGRQRDLWADGRRKAANWELVRSVWKVRGGVGAGDILAVPGWADNPVSQAAGRIVDPGWWP